MLSLALLPHFIPGVESTLPIVNRRILELWIAGNRTAECAQVPQPDVHADSARARFAVIAVRRRAFFFPALIAFIRRLRETAGFLGELAGFVLSVLHSPPVSVLQAREFEGKFSVTRRFEVHGILVTFCENQEDEKFGMIARTQAGISVFEITPTSGERDAEPEEGMKPTVVRRAQIDLSGGPFQPFVQAPADPPRSRALAFLSRLGLLAPESRVRPTSWIENFDKLCQPIRSSVPIRSVVGDVIGTGRGEAFTNFLNDIGSSYPFGICEFRIHAGRRTIAPGNFDLI
jgi:hypothetical protein